MKTRAFLLLLTIIFIPVLFDRCTTDKSVVTAKGELREQGITSYQYGTHVLQTSSDEYALRSSEVELDSFTGQKVRLEGTKVEGYPIEGGPVLLEVHKIKKE